MIIAGIPIPLAEIIIILHAYTIYRLWKLKEHRTIKHIYREPSEKRAPKTPPQDETVEELLEDVEEHEQSPENLPELDHEEKPV